MAPRPLRRVSQIRYQLGSALPQLRNMAPQCARDFVCGARRCCGRCGCRFHIPDSNGDSCRKDQGRRASGFVTKPETTYPVSLHLAIVTIAWFVALAAALRAIFISIEDVPPRSGLAVSLALVALSIGYLGFGRWSPFRFFPQVGWMWSEGDKTIYLASGWFFVAPILLGMTALALLALQRACRTRPTRSRSA